MLTTPRLVLKSFEDTDVEKMVEILTDPKIKETFMIPDFETKENAIRMFERMKEQSCSEEHYVCGIYLQGELIGFVNDVELKENQIELGYVIHPKFQNHGYATEMLDAVIQELFRKGFKEVVTGAFETNGASRKVMEKCGMRLIDKVEDIEYRGKVHHCVYYLIQG